jgi:hypothetical protein
MGENIKQFYCPEDGCVYFYDKQKSRYRKVCDIVYFSALPSSVKRQIIAVKQEALDLIELPTE